MRGIKSAVVPLGVEEMEEVFANLGCGPDVIHSLGELFGAHNKLRVWRGWRGWRGWLHD